MTLFERAAPHEPVFAQALDKYYGGRRDAATLAWLDARQQGGGPVDA
jgi:uncharacterized protein (DUF1810 family)